MADDVVSKRLRELSVTELDRREPNRTVALALSVGADRIDGALAELQSLRERVKELEANPLDSVPHVDSAAPFTDQELRDWQLAVMEPLLNDGVRGDRALKLARFLSRVLADKSRAEAAESALATMTKERDEARAKAIEECAEIADKVAAQCEFDRRSCAATPQDNEASYHLWARQTAQSLANAIRSLLGPLPAPGGE